MIEETILIRLLRDYSNGVVRLYNLIDEENPTQLENALIELDNKFAQLILRELEC